MLLFERLKLLFFNFKFMNFCRYEIGVLFVPKQFSETTFSLQDSSSFVIPYDLPPVKYQSTG